MDMEAVVVQDLGKCVNMAPEVIPVPSQTYSPTSQSMADNRVDNHIDNRVKKVVKNYYGSLEPERRGSPEKQGPPQVHFTVPFWQNENYIGKSQTYDWLEKRMRNGNTIHHRVALWGIGGAGKTQDVLQCIYLYTREHPNTSVFWINAGTQVEFIKGYDEIAALAGLAGHNQLAESQSSNDRGQMPDHDSLSQGLKQVREWLQSEMSGNWILVLDNADNRRNFLPDNGMSETAKGQILTQFIPQGRKRTVIITTRDREVGGKLAPGHLLKKQAMDDKDAMDLFKRKYERFDTYGGDKSIPELLKALHYLPLAVVQAAAFLSYKTGYSPSQYLETFRNTKAALEDMLSVEIGDIQRNHLDETVLTTFAITTKHIHEQLPLASSVLQIMGCVDNHNIPLEFIEEACQLLKGEKYGSSMVGTVVAKLENFALMTPRSELHKVTAYDMHSLIHLSVRAYMLSDHEQMKMDTSVRSSVQILAKLVSSAEYDKWMQCSLYVPHVSALAEHIKKLRVESTEAAGIYHVLAEYLLLSGQYCKASDFCEMAVNMRKMLCGPLAPDTLASKHNLALIYQGMARYKEAEKLSKEDEKLSKEAEKLSKEAEELWKEAAELLKEIIEVRKKSLGPEHAHTLAAITNLASCYMKIKDHKEDAEKLGDEALTLMKKSQVSNDALLVGNLMKVFKSGKNLRELEKMGLAALRKGFGSDHSSTLTALVKLAKLCTKSSDKKVAEQKAVAALESHKRLYPHDHPSTLACMVKLAKIQRKLGNLEDATKVINEAVEAHNRVFGPKHRATKACKKLQAKITNAEASKKSWWRPWA